MGNVSLSLSIEYYMTLKRYNVAFTFKFSVPGGSPPPPPRSRTSPGLLASLTEGGTRLVWRQSLTNWMAVSKVTMISTVASLSDASSARSPPSRPSPSGVCARRPPLTPSLLEQLTWKTRTGDVSLYFSALSFYFMLEMHNLNIFPLFQNFSHLR